MALGRGGAVNSGKGRRDFPRTTKQVRFHRLPGLEPWGKHDPQSFATRQRGHEKPKTSCNCRRKEKLN